MIALVLAAALTDPTLIDLRYQASLAAWSMCIDGQMGKLAAASASSPLPKAAQVQVAMKTCYVFGQDVKRTVPDTVVQFLEKQGVKSYGPDVLDMLTDETFRRAEEEMRKAKETS
jgi:hypothetical protein